MAPAPCYRLSRAEDQEVGEPEDRGSEGTGVRHRDIPIIATAPSLDVLEHDALRCAVVRAAYRRSSLDRKRAEGAADWLKVCRSFAEERRMVVYESSPSLLRTLRAEEA